LHYNGRVTTPHKVLLALLVIVLASAAGAGLYVKAWLDRPLLVAEDTKVVLAAGQSFSSFARQLEADGVLSNATLWSVLARLDGSARRVQAGEYWLRTGDRAGDLLDRLLAGEVVRYEVKLIEGWTLAQALAALFAHPDLDHELAGADESTVLGVLGLPEGHGEGLFFPDTYHFERGTSDADILRRAYRKLEAELAAAWQSRDSGLPYDSAYDALIVASLIEKETGRDSDRASIAQVFVSRLHRGMRLQTDPSVIYGVGPMFDGNLTRRHLRTDTPYNTYTRKGLPPTPIALVGRKSLAAAMHPAPGEFLYFVSRGDGSSHFSVSLEEHQAAVRRYQLQ
jgi:UPF0755 protein